MADKKYLEKLASDIQAAVANTDLDDKSGWILIHDLTEKLRRATEPPFELVNRQRFHVVQNMCLSIASDIGLFAQLAANQGKSMSASDLSNATGYHHSLIARVMRVMTALGFADEVGYQTYTANPVTINTNHPGAISSFMMTTEMLYPMASKMKEFLIKNKPCDPTQMTPAWNYTMGEPFFASLRKNDDWKKGFDEAMTFKQEFWVVPWFRKYPFENKFLKPSPAINGASADNATRVPVIIDIGGNQGFDLQRFAVSYPSVPFDLVLEDLPETIKRVPSDLDSRIRAIEYDFFTEQPIKGADIYYLKSVLHDWDDVASMKILSNTARAMDSCSRLLINDMVLSDTDERAEKANLDMTMLFVLNGMERTKTQWTELLANVQPPLRILDIWSVPEDTQSVIEACLAE